MTSGQTPRPCGPIALFVALVVSGVCIIVPANTAYTDECLAAPNSPAPQGNHWYFRIDGAKSRKCWYFRALGQSGQQVVAKATSASAPPTRLQSIKTRSASNAAPPASASMSTSHGSSAHPAPIISVTLDSDVEPSGREGSSPASSIPEAHALRKATTQADVSNPAPMIAAGDTIPDADVEQSRREGSPASLIPQALASQESATPAVLGPTEDTGVVSVRSRANGQASYNAESTAKRLFRILPCHGCMSFLSSQLHPRIASRHKWKVSGKDFLVLLILIFGLALAGVLSGVAMKIVRVRRERVILDHSEPNLIDDQHQHERRDSLQESESYQQESDLPDNLEQIPSSAARPRNSAPEAAQPPGATSRSSTLGLTDGPLLRDWPFLRRYTLPGLPSEEAFTYVYFEESPAVVGRRSADA
jgi:hypothetical protein